MYILMKVDSGTVVASRICHLKVSTVRFGMWLGNSHTRLWLRNPENIPFKYSEMVFFPDIDRILATPSLRNMSEHIKHSTAQDKVRTMYKLNVRE